MTRRGSVKDPAQKPVAVGLMAKLGFALSICAFALSALSFLYQYVPHEKLTYVLTKPTAQSFALDSNQPRTFYVQSTLTLFNRGNTTASLISADAFLIKGGKDAAESNDRCGWEHPSNQRLPTIEFVSSTSPYRPYTGVVEQAKTLVIPLTFVLRTGNEIKVGETLSGLVCLRLRVADSDGNIYEASRPLIGVTIDVADSNSSSNRFMIQTRLEQDYPTLEQPRDIYDRVHLRAWF
jgi:hypothetical protein